jgi:hypothetical protein
MPDGRASFEVIVPSNGIYTLEISADLMKWGYGFTLEATNNRILIVSPEPVVSMANLFLRARVGRGLYPDLGLHFHVSAGTFGGAFVPAMHFPVTLSSYSAHLDVEDGEAFPDGTNVVFTGPAGSGLVNALSGQFAVETDENRAWYQSPEVSTPVVPPPGLWTVRYQATNLTFHLPDAEVNTHLMIPVPTVVVAGGVLQRVTWTYRNPVTGSPLPDVPPHALNIQVQLDGNTGPGVWARLYNSDELTIGTTSHTLATPLNWIEVTTLHLAYDDDLGNHYVVSYQR